MKNKGRKGDLAYVHYTAVPLAQGATVGIPAVVGVIGALALAMVAPMTVSANVGLTQISSDPFTQATCAASTTTYHHTEVEPDTFSNGSTIVAAFQVSRIFDGGACAAICDLDQQRRYLDKRPFACITKWTGSGPNDRTTDESVAYDAKHNVWPISSLTLLEAGGVHGNSVVTSRSTDGGLTWGNPFTTVTGGDLAKTESPATPPRPVLSMGIAIPVGQPRLRQSGADAYLQ